MSWSKERRGGSLYTCQHLSEDMREKMENVFFAEDLVRQILNRSTVSKAGENPIKMFM